MALFPAGVEQAQAALSESLREGGEGSAELVAALGHPRLVNDAEAVDELVSRFSRAEIEGRAIGRYGGVKFFPALGDLLGRKLARVDQGSVKAAIAKAVGGGYAFLGGLTEAEDVQLPGREPQEIWDVWAPGLNAGLIEQTALPADMVSAMRQAGASIFREDALALGLGGLGKKGRLGHLGGYYAQAGAVLRALQTHPEPLRPDPANIWSYDDYPP